MPINFAALAGDGARQRRDQAGRRDPGDPPPGPRPPGPADLAALLAAGAGRPARRGSRRPAAHQPRYWLTRTDFTTPFIAAGPQPAQRAAAGPRALEGRRPRPGRRAAARTGSEAAILRIAASLAAGVPVRLGDAVTGLDDANLTAVAIAIWPPAATIALTI